MSKKSKARGKARNSGTSATASRFVTVIGLPGTPMEFVMTCDVRAAYNSILAADAIKARPVSQS